MTPRAYLTDLVRSVCADRTHGGPDERTRALAARQHGVVARWELLCLGLSRDMVGRRVRSGALRRLHPGVYAVGHACLTLNGRRMAAVLAAGPDAVLSHRDAAALHALRPSSGTRWDVTTSGTVRRVPGIVVRRTDAWRPHDVTIVDGIPATSVARTLYDLAGVVGEQALDSAFAQADLLRLDLGDLDVVATTLRGRTGPGPARLARARTRFDAVGAILTRSEGEELLRALLADFGLPPAVTNRHVGGDEVDVVWPEAMVGIELDSWKHHQGKVRFVRDRAKLRRLTLAGWTILPYTAFELRADPGLVASETLALLKARASKVR
jgi:very-short-patch-repair endonuclease